MASAEIENLNALRDLIADLPEWIAFTGLATTAERLARVLALELDDTTELPAIAIDFGAGQRVNYASSDSSANFRPSGTFGIALFAEDDPTDGTMTERFTAFADRFFQIIDELIVEGHETPFMVGAITYSDQPISRSAINVHHSQDVNDDAIDDATERPIWHGSFLVSWGGPPEQ